jgi:hypothetical protein
VGAVTVRHPRSILQRFIDPGTTISEILFGLIMTLTFTLGAGILIEGEGPEAARELLIAALGCNIAWGFIDAAFYLIDQLFDRGRRQRLAQMLRQARSPAEAESLVASELDELLGDFTSATQRTALYRDIVAGAEAGNGGPSRLTKADVSGAIVSGLLVIASCVPAAIPFVFMDDGRLALRLSNAILLGLLFLSGFSWARHTLHNPWFAGLSFLLGGVVLVIAAILLGG